jgi:signal transduction histidine kinase
MNWLHAISDWATGYGKYHTLFHCMGRDVLWVAITVTLDLAVAAGYGLIAIHWWKNQLTLPASPARSALGTMRNIFGFCGICGYVFIPIKMFWPGWRVYDIFLAFLVYYTWRYALGAKNLKVIYSAIGRSNQLAEDLARSQEESKRKSFFLNAVSHDLRTPLNGLMLQANLAELQMASGDTPGVKSTIDEIKAAVQMTANLLDGLLDFARLESAEDHPVITEFSLDALLAEVLSAHAAAANRKSLQLGGSVSTGLTVSTDRLKLERILNNLLANAIKFTSAGSVNVRVQGSGEGIEIHVIDTGIGIAPLDQQRLFDEFFQANNHERDRQKGFGLGLAICQRLARQLDGELQVQSSIGNGSRFTLVLPHILPPPSAELVITGTGFESATVDRTPAAARVGGGG